jgi:hypothetical protein
MAGTLRTSMSDTTLPADTPYRTRIRIINELRELVVALDRRAPRVGQLGEIEIARAAADLRIEALRRIDELEGESTN